MLEFNVVNLTSSSLPLYLEEYQSYLIPSALSLLKEKLEPDSSLMSLMAYQEGLLVGLALTQFYHQLRTAEIQSIVVKEEQRQKGIGLALFQFMQDFLIKEKQCRAMAFGYDQASPYAVALEKIISRLNWLPPKLSLVRCHYDHHFNPPWLRLPYQWPSSCEIFLWKDLTEKEEKQIAFQDRQWTFLAYLSPFRDKEKIEYLNSIGLRYKDRVIGWSITHRLDSDTIRYSSLYMDKNFHHLGYGILLLIESIRLQKQSLIPKALFEINVAHIEPTWWRFVQRRLIPYANRVEKINRAVQTFI